MLSLVVRLAAAGALEIVVPGPATTGISERVRDE
jgi:hypothetical protein